MFYLDNQSEKMNNWHILLLFRQIKIINTKARTLFSYTRKIPVPENRGIKEAVNTYIPDAMRATADSPSVASPTVLIDKAKVRNKKSPMSFNVT